MASGAGYAAGGASAAVEAAGGVADIFQQLKAEELRKQALDAARLSPILTLGDDNYEGLSYLGDFNPAMYDTPESAQASLVTEDPATRAIQMEALQNLIGQANGAADASNAAEQFQALDSANRMANSREGAIRQEMERKGQGGTGVSALMRAQSAQMGANRAKAGTLDAVSQAALQKLAAQQGAVSAAGNVRGQDVNVARGNADALNDFNRFNVSARNAVAQKNVDMKNAASQRNLGTKQDIAGRNVGIRNSNLDRKTQNKVLENNSQVQRIGGITGALGGQATQAANSGQVYNQLGQQGGKLFNNIGAGAVAADNAKTPAEQTYEEEWI